MFFFNDTATTEIYTLSLHDALPIYAVRNIEGALESIRGSGHKHHTTTEHGDRRHRILECCGIDGRHARSEEHTSELQSLTNLVCRLLLEKKKIIVATKKRPTTQADQ